MDMMGQELMGHGGPRARGRAAECRYRDVTRPLRGRYKDVTGMCVDGSSQGPLQGRYKDVTGTCVDGSSQGPLQGRYKDVTGTCVDGSSQGPLQERYRDVRDIIGTLQGRCGWLVGWAPHSHESKCVALTLW